MTNAMQHACQSNKSTRSLGYDQKREYGGDFSRTDAVRNVEPRTDAERILQQFELLLYCSNRCGDLKNYLIFLQEKTTCTRQATARNTVLP
jgi:hypothetical protein